MSKAYVKVTVFILSIAIIIASNTLVFAHSLMLTVSYDDCNPRTTSSSEDYFQVINEDGHDEWWYDLTHLESVQRHISDNVDTIIYYFADSYAGYSWTTEVSEEEAESIKETVADSMKKWNSVYYYSYDENGNRTSNKIITIEEGNKDTYNVIIYPAQMDNYASTMALDYGVGSFETVEYVDGVYHKHYRKYSISINVMDYHNDVNAAWVRERTGAHEMGHVLGLFDLDAQGENCGADTNDTHHQECLMGYGDGVTHITYKDIAGVSITRGFHTDDDHVWMLRTNDDGTQDVICALCNGVRYDIELDSDGHYEGKSVNAYKSCTHHGGSNDEMLLVATDGERDFYKCLYCRYIEERDHTTHLYTEHQPYSPTHHIQRCEICKEIGTVTGPHVISADDIGKPMVFCMLCGRRVLVLDDTIIQVPGTNALVTVPRSANGSYVLPNGIIVLVDEDVEAYFAGTLVFYEGENVPLTE